MKLEEIVSKDPGRHSGDLVFAGTRVPVVTLIHYLQEGSTLEDFLEGFPSVSRAQAVAYLDFALEATDGVVAIQEKAYAGPHG